MVKIMSYIKNNIEYIVFIVLLLMLIYVLSNRYFENFFTEQHGINRLDAIIYINLENRADRKDLLLKELETLNTNMSKVHKISGVYIPKNGHKGCIQSHILALNMCKLNNWDRVLILEDDAQLTTNPEIFNNIINKTLDYLDTLDTTNKQSTQTSEQTQTTEQTKINNGWDVIMLATANKIISNTTTYNKTLDIDIPDTPEQDKETKDETKQETKQTLKLEKITSATTSSAYIVRNNYIDRILNLFKVCNNNMQHGKLSSNNHETYALDQQWITLQQQDNWFALSPDIIKQREIWSTIMSQSHK